MSHMEIPAQLAAGGAPEKDLAGSSIAPEYATPQPKLQAAPAKSVFGRDYIVVRAPVPKRNPRITGAKPSRIRAWRAP
jgi:hypothetical protein